jgi:hypothetical protein
LASVPAAARATPVTVYARYDARVVHIETIGTLFNDDEEVSGASGLLIGNDLVLTNDHVIPIESNYRTLIVNVRPKSRGLSPPLTAHVLERDGERDLAILKLDSVVSGAAEQRCPMPVINDAGSAPPGTEVYVMGFPLNQDLSINRGLISNQSSDRGRWQTDSLLNRGNSGGPVFDGEGALVGVAVGGVVTWTFGSETHNVTGVNFVIPATLVRESPIFARISALPSPRRCWTDVSYSAPAQIFKRVYEAYEASRNFAREFAGVPPSTTDLEPALELPYQINRTFSVSEALTASPNATEDQTQKFSKLFAAEPEYKISTCTWNTVGESGTEDVACSIGEDAKSASFGFRVTGRPAEDGSRGWWVGTVELAQQRIGPEPTSP